MTQHHDTHGVVSIDKLTVFVSNLRLGPSATLITTGAVQCEGAAPPQPPSLVGNQHASFSSKHAQVFLCIQKASERNSFISLLACVWPTCFSSFWFCCCT